jgi:hypothetical protein
LSFITHTVRSLITDNKKEAFTCQGIGPTEEGGRELMWSQGKIKTTARGNRTGLGLFGGQDK